VPVSAATPISAEEKARIAKRVAAYEAGKVEMERRALAMQVALAERFPACFKLPGQPRLPLKVGIDQDIINIATDLSETNVKQAIKRYAAAGEYYLASIEGAVRVDLGGEPAGVVTQHQARWAQIKLGQRHHE
jgi:ProP effector